MKLYAGIDEAGRGPVIGPMVMAIAAFTNSQLAELKALNVRDSKMISKARRIFLSGEVKKHASYFEIISLSPDEIDDSLNSPSMNLNKLEAKGTAKLISNALKGNDFQLVIDLPSNNAEKYRQEVRGFIDKEVLSRFDDAKIILEHKADANYVEAGAASILAKVERDKAIEAIREEIGVDFGSGYPADPKTAAFIRDLKEGHKKYVRKTWASYKRIHGSTGQKKLKF